MLTVVFNHWVQTFPTHHEETQASMFLSHLKLPPCISIVPLMRIFLLLSPGIPATLLFPQQGLCIPYPLFPQNPLPTHQAKGCVHVLNSWELFPVPLIYRFLISLPFYAHWCPEQFWADWINQRGWLGSPMANILSQAEQQPWWNSLKWSRKW